MTVFNFENGEFVSELAMNMEQREFYEIEQLLYILGQRKDLHVCLVDIQGLTWLNCILGQCKTDSIVNQVRTILMNHVNNLLMFEKRREGCFFFVVDSENEHLRQNLRKVKKLVEKIEIENLKLNIYTATRHTDTALFQDKKLFLRELEKLLKKEKVISGNSFTVNPTMYIFKIFQNNLPKEALHSYRVGKLAREFSEFIGLSNEDRSNLWRASLLHDIGKLKISKEILSRSEKLNEKEWMEIKSHPQEGKRLLQEISAFQKIAPIVEMHHERWDGNGYPNKIKREEILYEARILSVIDSYDAMRSERSYKKAYTKKVAILELEKCSGSQFDPYIIKLFLAFLNQEIT